MLDATWSLRVKTRLLPDLADSTLPTKAPSHQADCLSLD